MRRSALLFAVVMLGCHSSAETKVTSAVAPAADCDPARDRAAILRMAGDYDVEFEFAETEALTAGYMPRGPYVTNAREVVIVLEDSPRFVSLQHLLLLRDGGGEVRPQKHWRQDWRFEDATLLEFKGKGLFERRALPAADGRCTWSQAVFEVSDAPRYESAGRWTHTAAESAWTSARTWRPLPRREYTKRSDYDVLIGTNRHVITASGWRHEQDNTKRVLATGSDLVREKGVNRYTRAELAGAAVVRAYMHDTAEFWSAVRSEWSALAAEHSRFTFAFEVSGKQLYEHLFPLADELRSSLVRPPALHVRRAPYVAAVPSPRRPARAW